MLFIKEPVDETKMELSDKRLALELKGGALVGQRINKGEVRE